MLRMYSQHAKIECKNMFCFFTLMTLVYFVFEKNSKDIHGCMEQTAHKYFLPQRNLYFLSEKYMSLVDSLVILSKYNDISHISLDFIPIIFCTEILFLCMNISKKF